MCGIAGIIRFDNGTIDAEVLRRISGALRHRGPDGEGVYINGQVGFAHRRLAIIDPKGGHQPFVDEGAGLALTYNGEVYNYKEIRRELVDRERLHTESDTEIVLASYRERGIECLRDFRGMFAFALHDRGQNRLYLVRDRVGIKPLYYSVTPDRLVFASELNALMQSGLIENHLDTDAITSYFRYGYVPTPRSIYASVKKLPAATYLAVDLSSSQITLHRYWSLSMTQRWVDEGEALNELNHLLQDTVRLYLRSDVPFGAFLSGGVDSSTVSALVTRELTAPLHTFTIGFREEAHSEMPHARFVADQLRTEHSERIVSSRMLRDVLPLLVQHFGEPFGDSSAIPTYYVSQAAAAKVRMVLSGDGGDELFAGYDSYSTIFAQLNGGLVFRKGLLRQVASRLCHWLAPGRADFAVASLQEMHDSQREIFREGDLFTLLGRDLVSAGYHDVHSCVGVSDPITKFQYQDLTTYLPDDVLTKVDRMSMANSLEVRVPLLDHKIVEFAFSLPSSMRLRAHADRVRTKHLLKRSAERFLPPECLDRPKMGFGIPVVQWLAVDLSELVRDSLGQRNHPAFNYIDYAVVSRIVQDFYDGHHEQAAKVWFLLMFKLWADMFHDQAVSCSGMSS